jgi:hypothetical protein
MVFRGEFYKKIYFLDRIDGPVNGENVYFNIIMVNYGPKLNVRFPGCGGFHCIENRIVDVTVSMPDTKGSSPGPSNQGLLNWYLLLLRK